MIEELIKALFPVRYSYTLAVFRFVSSHINELLITAVWPFISKVPPRIEDCILAESCWAKLVKLMIPESIFKVVPMSMNKTSCAAVDA